MRDYTPVKVVRWKVLHLLLTIASTQGALVLTSDQQFAQLRGDITLTCNTSDSNTSVQFEKDKNYVGRCSSFGCEKSNPTKFIVIRNTEPAGYNVTITDFKVNDAGYYTCLNSYIREPISGKNITYAVDIMSVTLTPKANPISVIENTPQLFQCLTSISRPKANVTWYLGSEKLTSVTESSPSQDVTVSTLNYTSQRKNQNMKIHCQGSNGDGPSQIVCKLGGSTMSSGVSVKEGWEFGLDCSSDGNPSPSFSWTHPGDGPSNPLFIRSINRTHAGRFTIIARSNLIPSEQQAVNLTKDIYVNVEVQYPPDPPSCRVGSSAISSNIVSAIRGNTISINCSFDSNPPSRNSWSVPGVSTPTSGQSFDLVVQKATTITLTMENSMQFTNGKNEQGRHESPIEVKVLCKLLILSLTG
ncbi:HMCN2-like protein [Mya arenaria]|uniref:HMCN2-like protein n=1 Tax=Mya arenaria TaxID=6604 RepID=A0ABY7E8C2_MYAAR|nr:HMCN2-like protein [Mya arenaria]